MRAFLALIIFIAVVVVLAIVWSSQHRTQTLPLVQAAVPVCPHFQAHPCARMNCARRIA